MVASRVKEIHCFLKLPKKGIRSLCLVFLSAILSISALSSASAASRYAAMVVDAKTGKVLFARHADKARYPASLTKMMTLYMLFGELRKKRLKFSSELTVTPHAAARPPSKLGLKPGQKITVMNAIRALVTKSANDVAATVAENLAGTEVKFAEEMTRVANKLGMKNTVFRNASGLPNASQRTTARDMITLSRRLYEDYPEYVYFFKTKYFAYKGKRFRNHNRLLFNYRGVEGIKTGYTRASGFNLATSYKRGRRHVYAVVMGGRTSKRRNAHMRNLLARYVKKATTKKRKIRKRREPELLTPVMVKRPAVRKKKEPVIVAVKVKPVHVSDTPKPLKRAAAPVYESNRVERVQEYDDIITGPVASTKRYNARLPHEIMEKGAVSKLTKGTGITILMKNGTTEGRKEPLEEKQPAVIVEEPVIAEKTEPDQPLDPMGPFHIQVGAFSNETEAQKRLKKISTKAKDLLRGHPALALPFDVKQKKVYRVRFAAFTKQQAYSTCRLLKRRRIECFVLRVE